MSPSLADKDAKVPPPHPASGHPLPAGRGVGGEGAVASMQQYHADRRGETIMEVMVAVFILSMVLTAILSLITYTTTGQQASEQGIIAQQLAREGIEVARNLRDSDFLAGVATSNSLKTSVKNFLTARFTPDTNSWVVVNFGFCLNWNFCPLWIDPASGSYQHDLVGSSTPFYRYLITDHICRDPSNGTESLVTVENTTCGAPLARVGTRVTSEVRWTDRGATKSVKLYDYLYDWK